ncbi:unnamed protein product [Phytophthora fragariaefolia]|uniref:Unnamed protein product n=1 Tax=Phytophthora fragariaefolia TaxID=1490495 RepID=A0A9W7D4J0_9STRA|nr:unnamed protein product [Phytophthora fragariaefolia]
MVTHRSSNRADRLARDTEASNAQRGGKRASSGRLRRRFVPRDDSSDDDSGGDDYYRKEDAEYDDPTASDELARQVREVSEMERLNASLRLELETHRPLAQVNAFSGLHMRRSLEDSSSEDLEDRSTDDDQSGSDFTLTRITLTSMIVTSRPPTTLSVKLRQLGRTAGLRIAGVAETSLTEGSTVTPATKALTDVAVSMDRVQHAEELTILPTTVSSVRRFKLGSAPTETGLVPIGLPQLASPPVDADCVYAFVGESKWLKTHGREEVNEVNTMTIEKERNGSFGGGESDERRYDEWNGGSSEGLMSSVTKKPWHDNQPENVIKLLSGERLRWWSAQKFDKRVRMRALVQGAVNDARTRILLDTGANVSVISERFAKQLRMLEVRDHGRCMGVQGFTKGTMATTNEPSLKLSANAATSDRRNARVMGPENERIDTEGRRVSTRPPTAGTSDEHLGPPSHVPGASTSIAVDSQRGPTEDGRVEGEIYQRCLAAQPSAVERVSYTTPIKTLRRPSESSEGSESDGDGQTECATATTEPATVIEAEVAHQGERHPKSAAHSNWVSESSELTQLKLEGAYLTTATVSEGWGDHDASNVRCSGISQNLVKARSSFHLPHTPTNGGVPR